MRNKSNGMDLSPQKAEFPRNSCSEDSKVLEKTKIGTIGVMEDDDSVTLKAGTAVVSESMGDAYQHQPLRPVLSGEDGLSVETTTLVDRKISNVVLGVSGEGKKTSTMGSVYIEVPPTRPKQPKKLRQMNPGKSTARQFDCRRMMGAATSALTAMQPIEGEDIDGVLFRGHSEISTEIDLEAVVRRGGSLVIKDMTPAVTLSDHYAPRGQVPGFTPITANITTVAVLKPLGETDGYLVKKAHKRDSQTLTEENSRSYGLGTKKGIRSISPGQLAASTATRTPRVKQGLLEQLITESIRSLNINRRRRH
ncbi:hypothetical protein SprV_0902694800 [Sparganum proliferum]